MRTRTPALARATMAGYYRRTDAAMAAAFDAILPDWCAANPTVLQQRWAGNPCGPGFADSRDAAGRLAPVDDVEYTHRWRCWTT